MEDLIEICTLFDRNVQRLQSNLSAYHLDVNNLRQTLVESWSHVGRSDGRIISAHDGLLSSISEVNEFIIKLNLHIKLNRVGVLNVDRNFSDQNNNEGNHTNWHGIKVGELDSNHEHSNGVFENALQLLKLEKEDALTTPDHISNTIFKKEYGPSGAVPFKVEEPLISADRNIKLESSIVVQPAVLSSRSILQRTTKLLPPKGGIQMSSDTAYNNLSKNIAGYVKDSVVLVTMMHLNIAENCIFVSKWGPETTPLKKLLECQMQIQQLDQFPYFGEIFAVYDAQEQIIPRVLINAYTEGGGYEAYLVDYGEHIHLNGEEVIFSLPNELKALPAEAVKCSVPNYNVAHMKEFIFTEVRVRILANNGNELEVELLEHGQSEPTDAKNSTEAVKLAAIEILDEIEPSTSDAVKAVLGYKPNDDQLICRHYDPKINGCFKGSNCRLLHQPLAPHGATKDKELAEPLPECKYISKAPRAVGSVVRVRVTFVSSPTHLYVQFEDDLPPLVWAANEVHETQRKFKRNPCLLDIVLALYNDNCYYRAQIVEEINGVYKIFYIDYGNTEFVTIESLAQCDSSVSLKPHRAINCFIASFKCCSLATQERTAECVELLKSIILNKKFDVKLIGHVPDGYTIQFLDNYAYVTKLLLQRGYVEPV